MLRAAGLPDRWRDAAAWTIVDTGFALGDTCLALRDAWRADPRRPGRMRYVGLLPDPDAFTRLRDRDRLRSASRLCGRWPPALAGVVRLHTDDPRWQLTLVVGDAAALVPGLVAAVDTLLVLRSEASQHVAPQVLRTLARAVTARGAAVLTSRGAGARSPDRDPDAAALQAAGLSLEPIATDPPAVGWCGRRTHGPAPAPTHTGAGEALVVGAGLAGCAAAFSLALRGWSVTRIDAHAAPASAASGQPALAHHPSVTPDDAPLSRLTRAALLLCHGPHDSDAVRWTGRLQRLPPARAHAAAAGLPSAWVQAVDATEAQALAGAQVGGGGLWLPLAGVADPGRLCATWTTGTMRIVPSTRVATLERAGSGWCARDAQGRALAEAPVAIVATGADDGPILRIARGVDTTPWHAIGDAGVQRRIGRTLRIAPAESPGWRCVVGGDHHVAPLPDGGAILGPVDGPDALASARALWQAHRQGRPALDAPLPGVPGADSERLSLRDHLPVVGPIPDAGADIAGIHPAAMDERAHPATAWITGGFGGRGLLWSVLAAEMIAARLCAEPAPIEASLARRLDPNRFRRPTPTRRAHLD